jgi:uncharacterized RmlC-like cupin family protein
MSLSPESVTGVLAGGSVDVDRSRGLAILVGNRRKLALRMSTWRNALAGQGRSPRRREGWEYEPEETMTASGTESVRIVAPGQTYEGKQGFVYGSGVSAETVGATQICMNTLPMRPGARAKVHLHRGIDTIAYLLEGDCSVYYGDAVECRVVVRTGEQVFMPADVPHAPCNESGAPCTWLVVHASGSDQEGIVLLPHLDSELPPPEPPSPR